MSIEEVREIYRRIAAKEPGHVHGDFLTAFAQAVVRADPENFSVVLPAAIGLIWKYQLHHEGNSLSAQGR